MARRPGSTSVAAEPALLAAIRLADQAYHLFADGESLIIGMSGGPDSVALADALRRYAPERALRLHVAHLDHMLRPGSADDAVYVAQLARHWQIPATIEALDVAALAAKSGRGLEEAARLARYAFLASAAGEVGAEAVVVAHHADDQAETVLMNLLRGSGLEGLKAMTPLAPYPLTADDVELALGRRLATLPRRLLRPLLDVPRSTIQAYLQQQGLAVREDPSNQDLRFLRNRIRHQILPLLEAENPRLRETLRRTSRWIADDLAVLEPLVDAAWEKCVVSGSRPFRFRRAVWQELPEALQRRLLRRAVSELAGRSPFGGEHIEAMRLAATGQPHPGLPLGLRLEGDVEAFWFTAESPLPPPRLRPEPQPIPRSGSLRLPGGWSLSVCVGAAGTAPPPPSPWTAVLDARFLDQGLAVRGRRAGDRLIPQGMGGRHRRLQDLFVDCHVPRAERDSWPLLVLGDEIIWVPGLRLAEGALRPSPGQDWLRLHFQPPTRLGCG